MLQDLFNNLKAEWENMYIASNRWIDSLESKYSKGSNAVTKATRESLSNMRFLLNGTEQQMQQANSDTHEGIRDTATKVHSYIENTNALHQELTQRSHGDDKTLELANTVEGARTAVGKMANDIYGLTSVNGKSTNSPMEESLPEIAIASDMANTGAPIVSGQVATEVTQSGNEISIQDGSNSPAKTPSTQNVVTTKKDGNNVAVLSNGHERTAKPLKARGQGHRSSQQNTMVLAGVVNHTHNPFLDAMLCLFNQQNPPVTYGITQEFIDITQLFFDNESFSSNIVYATPLSDSDIVGLTSSWNAVIAVFADPSHAGPCIQVDFPDDFVEVEATLFIIHGLLDTLYDHLETDIKRESTSILLPNLV